MASSEILAKIGLNSAGFKTGLAQCKLAANSFKSSVGGMFKNLGGQVLGMLGVSAGIAIWREICVWAKANFRRLLTPQNLQAWKKAAL